MAEIDGGSLSFKSQLDNDQLNTAIDETLRRIKGMSDGTVAAGDKVDSTFSTMASDVRKTLSQIGDACATHENALAELESKYSELGVAAGDAFMAGRDKEYQSIEEERAAIQGEIKVRKDLLNELRNQSNELEKAASKMEESTQSTNRLGDSHVSIRTKLREMREALIEMEMAGQRNTAEYRAMQEELGRLTDAYGDATTQANIMAHDQRGLQGVISGLSGMSGAVSAATGAMSLFAGENENLQKVMTKIQSVMAITMGLQQVEQTLNKDSAFNLVTLGGLKEWWNGVVAQSGVALTAETAAMTANAAATGAETVAVTAATTANVGLAGAIRLVGTAIKSIPVVGWILAAVSAIGVAIASIVKHSNDAKKAQQEFAKSTIDNCYKTIGTVTQLSTEWKKLGNDFQKKQAFIESNKNKFDELGVSITGVTDAENLLVSNTDAFINAEIAKAKAIATRAAAQDKVKELLTKQSEYDAMPDTKTVYYSQGQFGGMGSYETENTAKKKKKAEIDALNAEITKMFTDAANYETEGWNTLKNAGINGAGEYAAGTVGAIEQAISAKQNALKNATNASEYNAIQADIDKLETQLRGITGGGNNAGDSGTSKDPFLDMLNARKTEYQRFMQWMNSGDEILAKSASQEFAGLLSEGANYMDFLQKQRQQILDVDESERTAEQVANLTKLNDAIAAETRQTVIDSFNEQLNDQLSKATSTMEMLNIIAEKRAELANDNTDVDNAKAESLDNAESDVNEQIDKENADRIAAIQREKEEREKMYSDMLVTYASFEEKRAAINEDFAKKIAIANEKGDSGLVEKLEEARAKAISALATSELTDSEMWSQLFGNLDELTASQIDTLLAEIESKFKDLSGSFNPIDLQEIRKKLNEAKSVLLTDNPFKQLGESIKTIFNDAGNDSKESADTIKRNWKKLGESTEASFQFVLDAVNSCDFLKDAIGDVGATAISSMMTVAATSITVATAIKTAEKSSVILAIIQAALVVVQAVVDVVKSIVNQHDKKLEEQIEGYKRKVDDLTTAYNNLEYAISNALGGSVYELQKQSIANLEEQLKLVKQMEQAEKDQKKTDEDAVKEYQQQQIDIQHQIEDLYREMAEDMLQTTAKDLSDELGDALVKAFTSGSDAAKDFETTVNDVLKNIVVNQLKKQFLETQLQGALDDLQNSMGYWNGDTFVFDGLTESEIAAFKERLKNATDNFSSAYEIYADMFGDVLGGDEKSLSGAVKGVTEETASILAGQMNAMRINQIEGNEIMRQHLIQLTQIAQNTAYLSRIYTMVQSINGALGSNDLRAKGIIEYNTL